MNTDKIPLFSICVNPWQYSVVKLLIRNLKSSTIYHGFTLKSTVKF